MKEKLLSFIEKKCKDEKTCLYNRFCGDKDICQFARENSLSKTQYQELLIELHKEKKIEFGMLVNGYFITIINNK